MTMFVRLFGTGLALAFAGTVGLPVYGPAGATEGKKIEQKVEKQVQKVEEKKDEKKADTVVFKGEVKIGQHAYKMTAGQNYIIQIKAKGFNPMVQIRDVNNMNTYLSRAGGVPNGQDWTLALSWIPSQTAEHNILINNSFGQIGTAPMDYTIEISHFKPVLSVNGSVTNADPAYPLRNGCHHKVHTVKMEAGKTYQIDLVGPFDPYLYLEDAVGNVLAHDDDSGGNLNARIIHKVTKTDTYRIICTSCGQGATGNYTLTVSDTPVNLGPNVGGPIGIFPPPFPVPQPFPNPKPFPLPKPIFKLPPQPLPPVQPNGGIQLKIDGQQFQNKVQGRIEIQQGILPVAPAVEAPAKKGD